MITKKMYTWFLISVASFLTTGSVVFGAVFVVTNTNNQGPGSLRQAIENVNNLGGASNEIIVSLIDNKITVFLLSELPTITKQVTLNGFDQVSEQPIIIDGNNNATIGLHISGAGASNTLITNTSIHNIKNGAVDGPAYGIFIEDNANDCSVTNCIIQNVCSGVGNGAAAAGLFATNNVGTAGDVVQNTIRFIKSTDNVAGASGSVNGISVDAAIHGDCSQNIITDIKSGDCNQVSGAAAGISFNSIDGDCSGNIITAVNSGTSSNSGSGEAQGLTIRELRGNCHNNNIENIKSADAVGSTGGAVGIILGIVENGSCNENTITEVTSGYSETSSSSSSIGITIFISSGNCSKNTITNVTSGSALTNSGLVSGIFVIDAVASISHNRVQQLQSGDSGNESGSVTAIEATIGNGRCSYNIIDTLMSGSGATSGTVLGISIDTLEHGYLNNSVKNVMSGGGRQSGNVVGIQTLDAFSGDCINNTVCDLTVGQTSGDQTITGITLHSLDGSLIACNQIKELSGANFSLGLELVDASSIIVERNAIHDIYAQSSAIGLTGSLTNSLIIHNTISDIIAENGDGIGIFLEKGSMGNDILTNSIFDINTKAIAIENTDVQVFTLTSVRCSAGNRMSIKGVLLPEPTLANRTFLIQFFVSDSDTPKQIKTFIGECEHEPSSDTAFRASFVVQSPTKFGQFITATATALSEGTDENINTSEVSNALFACETQGGVCTIATCPTDPIPTPVNPCTLLANCSVDDVL